MEDAAQLIEDAVLIYDAIVTASAHRLAGFIMWTVYRRFGRSGQVTRYEIFDSPCKGFGGIGYFLT